MWILGDDFMSKSFGPYFQDIYQASENQGYIRAHMDVVGLCSGSTSHSLKGRNVISFVRNNFVEAINKYTLMPEYMYLLY